MPFLNGSPMNCFTNLLVTFFLCTVDLKIYDFKINMSFYYQSSSRKITRKNLSDEYIIGSYRYTRLLIINSIKKYMFKNKINIPGGNKTTLDGVIIT